MFNSKIYSKILFLFVLTLTLTGVSFAQGSYGTGKLPNTPPKLRKELKTIVLVEDVNTDELTFKATDEITGDKSTFRASKRTSISAEKSIFKVFGKKDLAFTDIKKGQRLEIKYNELLPTSVTDIKVLKAKDQ